MRAQVSKAGEPGLTSVSVNWEQYGQDLQCTQAPSQITSLFSGSRQVIYGYVPSCTQATLKANIDNNQVATIVSTSDLNITTGMVSHFVCDFQLLSKLFSLLVCVQVFDLSIFVLKILHRLTARAVIRDWEDGSLAEDRVEHEVLELSHCFISSHK